MHSSPVESRAPGVAASPRVIDIGRVSYADAYRLQLAHHEEVLAAREHGSVDASATGAEPFEWGRILLVEHDPPVITVSRRPGARDHLIATAEQLSHAGVEVAETDRGGDITYHGPGQLVAYPILDLNLYHLGLHAYMRLLEQSLIDTLADFGILGERDPTATGVWVASSHSGDRIADPPSNDRVSSGSRTELGSCTSEIAHAAKVAALGVRVRRWVSMHGLALNVTTNLEHFRLIVPCGLLGRPVTSMHQLLGDRCPSMAQVKEALTSNLSRLLAAAHAARPSPNHA